MSVIDEWPEHSPEPAVRALVSNVGAFTLHASSTLVNYATYDLAAPEIVAWWSKNGAKGGDIAISAIDGALTTAAGLVATGDVLRIHFRYVGRASLPWVTRVNLERTLVITVPANGGDWTFDGANHRMHIPSLDLGFGLVSGKLRVGVRATAADGAGEALYVRTRRIGGPSASESGTAVDLSSGAAQLHDASFTSTDATVEAEMELALSSSTAAVRQESRARIAFQLPDRIPAWDASFPSSGILLQHVKVGTTAKLEQP